MPITLTRRITSWRRSLLIALATLVAVLAISSAAPDAARADVLGFRNPNQVLASHTGWVYVRTAAPIGCATVYPSTCTDNANSVQTWWWSNQWNNYRIPRGTQVYAYPYTGQFHWIWTQYTGWLAIRTSNLDTGYSCTGRTCPMF